MTTAPVTGDGLDHEPAAERIGTPVLVVGVDGSPPSWDAFSWVAGEVQRSNGHMIAAFVTPLVDPLVVVGVTGCLGYGAMLEARDRTADELAGEVHRRAQELGIEVRFVREYGDVAEGLTRVAHSAHADVVAVGRSAKFLHRLTGSLSRRLVLSPDLPVVVVVP